MMKNFHRRAIARFVAYLSIMAALLGAVFFRDFRAEDRAYREVLHHAEEKAVNLQAQAIAGKLKDISSQIRFFSRFNEMHGSFRDPAAATALAEEFLVLSESSGLYDQLRFIDAVGMESVRVNFNGGTPSVVAAKELQDKSRRYYFRDTFDLEQGEIFVSPFDLNIEHGVVEEPYKPMIRVGTPVFDRNGKKEGIILFNYFGSDLLGQFRARAAAERGAHMLLNADSYWLAGPDRAREWAFMFPELREITFSREFPDAWARIDSDASGQFLAPGGLFTYATIYPLEQNWHSSTGSGQAYGSSAARLGSEDYFWKVVSHVPVDVVNSRKREVLSRLGPLMAFLILVAAVASWTLAVATLQRMSAEEEREKTIVELREALDSVRVLKGLLPICSSCKKIRDDGGYWHQVETYIDTHTDASFTHGLCPHCAERIYPGITVPPP